MVPFDLLVNLFQVQSNAEDHYMNHPMRNNFVIQANLLTNIIIILFLDTHSTQYQLQLQEFAEESFHSEVGNWWLYTFQWRILVSLEVQFIMQNPAPRENLLAFIKKHKK